MVTVLTTSRPARCAYCHASVGKNVFTCSGCGTACHPDCLDLAGSCPTLGCATRRRVRPSRPGQFRRRLASSVNRVLGFLFKLGFFVALLGIAGAIAIPNLVGGHRHSGETHAIGALRTIGTAQSLFREADKDKDGVHDYAESLEQLGTCGTTGLIDSVLASGTKNGYRFELKRSPANPEFCWIAYAWPLDPEEHDRVFLTNHEGVTYYRYARESTLGIVMVDGTTCAIPPGWTQVGR